MGLAFVDLSVAGDSITAIAPGTNQVIRVGLEFSGESTSAEEAFRQGFDRLATELARSLAIDRSGSTPRFSLRIALLPPLCDVRVIEMPRLRDDELYGVIRRDATRHFLGRDRDLVVGVERLTDRSNGTNGGPIQVLAAAASAKLVEALKAAAAELDWEIDRIVPAQAAWSELAESAKTRGDVEQAASNGGLPVVLAVQGDTTHLLRKDQGSIRRFPAADVPAAVAAAGPVGPVIVLAEKPVQKAFSDELVRAGWPESRIVRGDEPAVAAARNVGNSALELVPEFIDEARQRRARSLAVRLFASAAAAVVLAAAVHAGSLLRAQDAVGRQRAEIRDAVAPALAQRDSLDRLETTLADWSGLQRSAPNWALSLIEIAMILPPDTYLLSFRAAGDTLVLEAAGGRAGDALANLRAAPNLSDVRLEGPIRRDIEGGSTSRELFTLSAIVKPAHGGHESEARPVN